MKSQELKLAMPDGITDATLYTADNDKPLPGVLFIPDIWGPRPTMSEMAQRIAQQGYTVLVPNSFYRTSEPPVFPYPRSESTPEKFHKRFEELTKPLTPAAIKADSITFIDFLTSQKTTAPGGIGVIGFCIGGMFTFRAAAAQPDKVKVAASFHGGGLYKENDPDSPHRDLHSIKARLYFGHAIEDNSMNSEAIAGLEKSLKEWGGRFESEVYEGAHHGWTVPDNPAYNQPQAEHAFSKLIPLLKEELG